MPRSTFIAIELTTAFGVTKVKSNILQSKSEKLWREP
jgi:hypothetical protein